MVSAWWILWAFLGGGYAGALVIGLMSMAGAHREKHGSRTFERRERRHHAGAMYGSA